MIRSAAIKRKSQFGALPKWAASALDQATKQVGLTVVLDTNVSKPSFLYQAGKPPQETSRGAHLLGMFLQPTVYISSSVSREVVAPYGQAQHNYGPPLAVGAAVVGLLATYGLWSLVFGRRS